MEKKQTPIDQVINQVVSEMEYEDPGSEKYTEMTKQLRNLYETKSKFKDRLFSPDTLLVVGANLAGIVLILTYEKANIVTSKALGFILRSRL